MPKKVMDYSKCLIYKIVCNDLLVTDCYVGHTTNFKQRKNNHRIVCNKINSIKYNFKLYQTMRANGGRDNWTMVEIEKYPCNDFNEATARERYWYEILNANLNMCVPNRSQKEWCEVNKEYVAERIKNWSEKNKEDIRIKNLKRKEDKKEENKLHNSKVCLCECGITYTHGNKARHLRSQKHQTFVSPSL